MFDNNEKFDARALTILSLFAEQKVHRLDPVETADLVLERLKRSAEHTGSTEPLPNVLEIALGIQELIKDVSLFETDGWYISPTVKGLKLGELWLKRIRSEWER